MSIENSRLSQSPVSSRKAVMRCPAPPVPPPQMVVLRIAAGLSQDVLGLRLGISSTYLGRIERGLRPMPERLVEPWAGAIGVHADVLRAELQRGSVATTDDSNDSSDTSRVVSVK